ncbi:helix-turn-helix transcriptional regulator [Sulfitobacter albidus]|uniref:Helix-turn-helix transcriptional regulator n=1 Tax=Sulfitobacter albidus TaxID=2829501 RepID=A0A975PN61_9RHOB|nr:helix-turn-helix transcriptional regulator [Sulfitobacter albidus]QUJ76955.1 helix-turn-helix transcriptional regulator [Sulfitobacter albidus]
MFYNFKIAGEKAPIGLEQSPQFPADPTISGKPSSGAAACIVVHSSGTGNGNVSRLQSRQSAEADDTTDPSTLYLAPRELDVLRWAARGKTTWETAQLLNLSEATVAFYARRACARLNVKSKIHAVAVCISAGLFRI